MAEEHVRFRLQDKKSSGNQGDAPLEEEKVDVKYEWDKFQESSQDNVSSTDERFWQIIHKVSKIIFTIILFVLVLSTAVLHKSSICLLLSNISPPNPAWNSSLKTAMYHFRYPTSETSITYIWALVLVVVSPYIFTTLSSLFSLIFKKTNALEFKPLMFTFIVESLHSVGISLFVFGVLPNFDPLTGALFCMSIGAIPALLRLVFFEGGTSFRMKAARWTLSILGFATTMASVVFWCYYIYKVDDERDGKKLGLLVMSALTPLLVSLVWWDNYIPKRSTFLAVLRQQIQDMKAKIYSIIGVWKILLTLGLVSVLYGTGSGDDTLSLESLYGEGYGATLVDDSSSNLTSMIRNDSVSKVILDNWLLGPTPLVLDITTGPCSRYLPLYIAVVSIVSGIICYRCSIAANQILAQVSSFSLPLALATPISLAFMIALYAKQTLSMTDNCSLPFPKWEGGLDIDWTMIIASILGYVAIVSVSSHIWVSKYDRMQSGERMFSIPMYCGFFLDQSLILNRKPAVDLDGEANFRSRRLDDDEGEPGKTPKIYLCATMWHENDNEMTQLLKSFFRLDIDQFDQWSKNRVTENPDYYKFEAHVFFDDAFEDKDEKRQVNEYVRKLIHNMEYAHRSVYGPAGDRKMRLPSKVDTPYGGRLVWTLPFENKLIVHLKDKEKIRNRKRWSQVMYMYYLLSYKRHDDDSADNTFILALDGDVDFQPSALKLLVDIMKRNEKVGAACGRILPIGSGPMVWYQKFEYAVSHWLQKATEHTIGCVLCSPGCFSLFRGSHLMAENVMKRYTRPPTEARHYVQYDQGEDRWLCTLLLQQGFRVEYCAASDALTYAPEGFYEFYKQRRRWTPSTMANILDLLFDFKNVTERNNDISMLYIGYQMLLMVSSILTPGTIFLMILGAINMAYPTLSLYWALILNLIPVVLFIIFCFLAKPSTQLAYAAVLSTTYSLVMMLVIVGLIKQAADNGFCSVTTVFLCFVAGVFVIAAFIHPQEFWCILHGFLYFLAIPSMSMLLMLYSIGNLHIVTWGTRETAKPPAEQNAPKEKKSTVKEWLGDLGKARESEYMFSFGNLFRCICCPDDKRGNKDVKFEAVLERIDALESSFATKDKSVSSDTKDVPPNLDLTAEEESSAGRQKKDVKDKKPKHMFERDKSVRGKKMTIKEEEKKFWEQLIKKYLLPLNEDKEHKEKTEAELKELRNKVCLFFILTNALFVTIVFSMQQVNLDSGGSISKELPCANGNHGGSFEPISMAFTGVFGVLLLIQFICMIIHRMSTFLQICSITEVGEKQRSEKEKIRKNIETIKKLVSKENQEGSAVCDSEEDTTDSDSDDLEDVEGKEDDTSHQPKSLGPRGRFKKTLRVLGRMNTVSGARAKSAALAEDQIKKTFTGANKTSMNDIVKLAMDQRFQKSIKQRGQQMARHRSLKVRTPELNVIKELPEKSQTLGGVGQKSFETEMSGIHEEKF